MGYELGLFTRAYQDLPFDDMISKVNEQPEIKYLELTANFGSRHINVLNADVGHILSEVEKNDLVLDSLSIHRDTQLLLGAKGSGTSHFYPGTTQEQKEYAKKILNVLPKVAKELGIRKIIGNIGCECFSDLFEWPDKQGWKNQLENAKREWMPILENFSNNGVLFAHEIGPQQLAYDLDSSLELVDLFENINSFGFCVDPSQLLYLGLNPSICIETLGDKVFNFHAKDGEVNNNIGHSSVLPSSVLIKGDKGYRSRIPGWGDGNWKKIITSLKKVNYKGPLSIELEDQFFDIDEGLEKSIAFLDSVR